MKTYVIGDIHGCLDSLLTLAEVVRFGTDDRIVFLGDYVDRGPKSRQVIDWLLHLRTTHSVITLRGNHEAMMLSARNGGASVRAWLNQGGDKTLKSYGYNHSGDWVSCVPVSHFEFLESTPCWFEDDHYIFVHGYVDADKDMAEQTTREMLWRNCLEMAPHQSGKQVICGHKPQREQLPKRYDFGVCIDTGAYKGGWLTCLCPESGIYWQANELGEYRSGNSPAIGGPRYG